MGTFDKSSIIVVELNPPIIFGRILCCTNQKTQKLWEILKSSHKIMGGFDKSSYKFRIIKFSHKFMGGFFKSPHKTLVRQGPVVDRHLVPSSL